MTIRHPGIKKKMTPIKFIQACPFVQQRVAGAYQKNETKQVPLQFLGENVTGIKKIAHDHVGKNDQHQCQTDPGHPSPDPLVERVNPAAQHFKCIHVFIPFKGFT